MKFRLPKPNVTLVSSEKEPYNLAVATARTCYSSKGIISREDVTKDERAIAIRDKIATSTLLAGHLTTRQHAHFVFALDNISRSVVWSFLHSHPFYNSEQVSQRYVRVKPETVLMPEFDDPKANSIFRETVNLQNELYHQLIELLLDPIRDEYYRIFPARRKQQEKWAPVIKKKSYEVARYILPIGTYTYLYHTVSALTLLRYNRLSEQFDMPTEQRALVSQMINAVTEIDPDFKKEILDPIPIEETAEYKIFSENRDNNKVDIEAFDRSLDGMTSKLIDYKINTEKTLADAVRNTLGINISDSDAVDLLLNPAQNSHLGDTLNVTTMSKLSRVMVHAHYTFRKKISHTADSQDQRHRMTPASRPILEAQYSGKTDYITPILFTKSHEADDKYAHGMEEIFKNINRLLNMGAPFEAAQYLLPNAFPIRFEESGDLLNFHHKWKLRTCYNAQEEIFVNCVDELKQVSRIHPGIAKHILAPCYLRKEAGVKPFCPEGERFCGVPVWNHTIDKYDRVI